MIGSSLQSLLTFFDGGVKNDYIHLNYWLRWATGVEILLVFPCQSRPYATLARVDVAPLREGSPDEGFHSRT